MKITQIDHPQLIVSDPTGQQKQQSYRYVEGKTTNSTKSIKEWKKSQINYAVNDSFA